MQAREVFIAINQKIRFQQADKEADSHYTVLGNTLVRFSNHCTWMKIWDNYLQKNPQDAKRNILSLVFEDEGDTYTEECLFTVNERKVPIRVTEYVFKSPSLSKQDVKLIISSLQQMMTTNTFNEPTGKGERFDRISVNPDYMNLETTADGRVIPGGINGMDYSIEESKTHKNMNKKAIKINETQLRNMVAESVEKVLKEEFDRNEKRVDDVMREAFLQLRMASQTLSMISRTRKRGGVNTNSEALTRAFNVIHDCRDIFEKNGFNLDTTNHIPVGEIPYGHEYSYV